MNNIMENRESLGAVHTHTHTHTHGNNVLNKKRENNYDLLRIICAISVILIHVSNEYIQFFIAKENINMYNKEIFISCAYNVLTRFAVPCFFMLSGAFLLSDSKNKEYKTFYKKSFKNIGIHTIIFSIVYFVYFFMKKLFLVFIENKKMNELIAPILNLIKGCPGYHMWYLYSLIGIYLLIPIVIKIKDEIGENNFFKLSIIFLILSCISFNTSSHFLYWDIGLSFEYLGYIMIGYVIRNRSKIKKGNTKKSILWISLGILIEIIILVLTYLKDKGIIFNSISAEKLVTPLNPLVIISSIMIYKGFSTLEIKRNLFKISKWTFYIYLVHLGVYEIIIKLFQKISGNWNNIMYIPVISFLAFVGSLFISIIYKKIYEKIVNWKGEKRNV